jgi:hypothetical protein
MHRVAWPGRFLSQQAGSTVAFSKQGSQGCIGYLEVVFGMPPIATGYPFFLNLLKLI